MLVKLEATRRRAQWQQIEGQLEWTILDLIEVFHEFCLPQECSA
jgi:hypothetical protein